ncbi:Elongation factor-like GTPase 1 [Cryptosporidium felis]|nr:Elongation factor-like GTPase 1 [Cryptosporidium felis]
MCATFIRNVCIIAHVDHGKTTLADYLLASNNILSNKSAGAIRYLDSREDEQYRLITMKSSAVALKYKYREEIKLNAEDGDYLINLIDSPGHVDFTYEVVSSLRISDGALLLVDVAEGIGDQTRKVLQHAFKERLRIILVLNKMDRLIVELGFEVKEAFLHINKLIEQINVIVHQLIQEEVHELMLEGVEIDEKYQEKREQSLEFSFLNGNIVLTSCLHGWCLDIAGGTMLKSISSKLDLPWSSKTRGNLQKAISSNCYYINKTKKVTSITTKKGYPTMFEQFILEPIWNIYQSIFLEFSQEKIEKIVQVLGINYNEIEGHVKEYSKVQNKTMITSHQAAICKFIMANWIPLSKGIFERVINYIPDPNTSNDLRFPSIYNNLFVSHGDYKMNKDLTIVFISKFSACDLSNNRLTKDRLKGNEELNGFVGISRIFHGTLRTGDLLYISNQPSSHQVKVISLFNLLGSDLIPIGQVENGTVFAMCIQETKNQTDHQKPGEVIGQISSLDRTLTLSNHPDFPSFNTLYKSDSNSSSIIKVSIEPRKIQDLPLMLKGLELLSRSDPCVEIDTLDTGEYILGCHGEVHLERCISDLQFVFAQIPLAISKPLIAIREGIIRSVDSAQVNQNFCSHIPFPPWSGSSGTQNDQQEPEKNIDKEKELDKGKAVIPCELATICIQATSMDEELIKYIESNQALISETINYSNINRKSGTHFEKLTEINEILLSKLNPKFGENIVLIGICIKKGSITLLQGTDQNLRLLNWTLRLTYDSNYYPEAIKDHHQKSVVDLCRKVINGIITGFEIASTSGPLCEEPMRGVVFILNELRLDDLDLSLELSRSDTDVEKERGEISTEDSFFNLQKSISLISNQLTTTTKDLCRRVFLQRGNVRIYEIFLNLTIYCEQTVLGKVYSVINKRRGNVYNEELKEGTSTFKIEAHMPIIESLGIGQELRSKASGNISFSLVFSHWELLDEDPFPESSMTMEEFEDEGLSKINLLISNSSRYDYNLQLNFETESNGINDSPSHLVLRTSSGITAPNNEDDDNAGGGGGGKSASNNFGNNTNIARMIINSIRQRKGLPTQHKIVAAAEKQRTLNKKK